MVKIGMSEAGVQSLIGEPLWKAQQNGTIEWGYTQDHDPPGRDYAWFMRTLVISNGFVVSIIKQIAYD